MGWKSKEFSEVPEENYFLCWPYAQHDVFIRKRYTKMIFDFYDSFFPGITVHRKGLVKINELNKIMDGKLLSNYELRKETLEKIKVRIIIKKQCYFHLV